MYEDKIISPGHINKSYRRMLNDRESPGIVLRCNRLANSPDKTFPDRPTRPMMRDLVKTLVSTSVGSQKTWSVVELTAGPRSAVQMVTRASGSDSRCRDIRLNSSGSHRPSP